MNLLDKKKKCADTRNDKLYGACKENTKEVNEVFDDAYEALKTSNITMGTSSIEDIALSVPYEPDYNVLLTSVMGVEIPSVQFEHEEVEAYYGFFRTNPILRSGG